MSFADQINAIQDLPTGQLTPGTFYWLHGVKQAKLPGTFYVKDAEVGGVPAAPWVEDSRFDNERGYSAPQLKIAVIGWRSQWYLQAEQGKPKQWIIGYEQGAKKHTEFLCFAEGIDDVMILSADGANKEKPLSDIVKSYRDGLLKQASRVAKRGLPLWTFWLPIANRRTADGKPAYTEATDASGKSYGSIVTPPTLYLPDDAMDSCYVGEELMRRGNDIYREYTGWFNQKRQAAQIVDAEYTEVLALPEPSGKNVPVEVDEADLF